MDKKIFREKSLERVNSPESLEDYIQVSNPGVWMLLTAVILLLVGILVWGYFGSISSWNSVTVIVDHGRGYCYAKEETANAIRPGMTLEVNELEGTVTEYLGYYENFDAYEFEVNIVLPNGNYTGTVHTDDLQPKTLLFN